MSDDFAKQARLAMLGALNRQSDGRLNEIMLDATLVSLGFSRSRDWVRTQMHKMEELGAVRLTEVGDILIAAITRAGLEHYERQSNIDGIAQRTLKD